MHFFYLNGYRKKGLNFTYFLPLELGLDSLFVCAALLALWRVFLEKWILGNGQKGFHWDLTRAKVAFFVAISAKKGRQVHEKC